MTKEKMKLSKKELAVVSKLIDLNYEYFQAKKMHNPIVSQINDNPEYYQSGKPFEVGQGDLVKLRYKVEDFFNQKQEELEGRK